MILTTKNARHFLRIGKELSVQLSIFFRLPKTRLNFEEQTRNAADKATMSVVSLTRLGSPNYGATIVGGCFEKGGLLEA